MSRVIIHVQETYVLAPVSVNESYRHNPFFISVDVDRNVIQSFKFLNLTQRHWKFARDLEPMYKDRYEDSCSICF